MIEYVILGTSHEIQNTPRIDRCVMDAVSLHGPRLIAEEFTLQILSRVADIAKRRYLPYLQIDMFSEEQRTAGIYEELRRRQRNALGSDLRLSHADGVREGILARQGGGECR
jgi:hypothetical protein